MKINSLKILDKYILRNLINLKKLTEIPFLVLVVQLPKIKDFCNY
jgi:hypothetical protein